MDYRFENLCSLYLGFNFDRQLVERQYEKFLKEGMTVPGLCNAIKYFFDIKKGKNDYEHGIAILPYVYGEAARYFNKLERFKELNKDIEIKQTEIKVSIKPPKGKKIKDEIWR